MSAARNIAVGASGALSLILAAVFAIEGGYVNHPNDPGGETNHGVTKAVAVANGYTGPMKDLPKESATAIITADYVAKPGYMPLVERVPPVAHKLIDSSVLAGTHRPACWFQESLNHFNNRGADYPDVKVDCKVGPATIAAFEALERRRGRAGACELIVKALDVKMGSHLLNLSSNNRKYESFGVGWTYERIGNVDFRKCGR